MIANITIFLWLVFIGCLVYSLTKHLKTRNSQVHFFQTIKSDIPYIVIDIQGHSMNMLVDSGAGISLITESALSVLSYEDSVRSITLQGIVNESTPPDVVTVPISIKGREIKEDFVKVPVDDFAGFGRKYGISIHGLLGNEFFENTGCVIDYKNHSVSFD